MTGSGRGTVRWWAIAVLAIGVIAVLFFWFRGSATAAPPKPQANAAADRPAPQEVTVEEVAPAVLRHPVRVTGTLRTDETIVISTKATGLVRRVTVREGDRVRARQLLVEIDDGDLVAQRDRARAEVQAAAAAEHEAEESARSAELRLQQARTSRDIKNAAVEAEFRRAEQGLEAAKTRVSQARALAEIAGTEAETRVASARAALQGTRQRLKVLQDGARNQERAVAEAAVASALAEVNRTRSHLDRREQLLREGAIAVEAVESARRDQAVAQAALESARQQLSLVREGARTEEIRAAEEAVRQAEAAVSDAEANRARRQVSQEDVLTAEAAQRQAEAARDAARAALAQAVWNEDEIRAADAAARHARATLDRMRAATARARAEIRYQEQLIAQTRLYSPVDGVVTRRSVQVGAAVVQMRNELMTLVSSDTLYFEATAPEAALPFLREGMPARVMLDAIPGKAFPGVVRRIIPVAEGVNRAVRLRISIPRAVRGGAVVGGFARSEIRGGSSSPVISVPRDALVPADGRHSVYVVENGRAVRRLVRVEDPGGVGERVPVLAGLRPGERVVVRGASGLVDGAPVTVLR